MFGSGYGHPSDGTHTGLTNRPEMVPDKVEYSQGNGTCIYVASSARNSPIVVNARDSLRPECTEIDTSRRKTTDVHAPSAPFQPRYSMSLRRSMKLPS